MWAMMMRIPNVDRNAAMKSRGLGIPGILKLYTKHKENIPVGITLHKDGAKYQTKFATLRIHTSIYIYIKYIVRIDTYHPTY
jgi:hypothetical protein